MLSRYKFFIGVRKNRSYWNGSIIYKYMLAVLHSSGKLPAAIRPQKILSSLGSKNKGKILCGFRALWRIEIF